MDAAWHPVALASDVEPSTSAGVHLNGKELVVWRDDKAHVHVWEDRCPHRGMRLSFGFVRGDHLACLYHGWQYDRTGQCRHIPAHPDLDVPATIKVPAYRSREWAGIIWTSLVEEEAPAEEIEGMTATPVRSIYLDRTIAESTAALLAHQFSPESAVKQLEQNLCLIKSGGDQLLAAFQPVSDTRTGMHVVVFEQAAPEKLKQHADSLETFRHAVETGALAHV